MTRLRRTSSVLATSRQRLADPTSITAVTVLPAGILSCSLPGDGGRGDPPSNGDDAPRDPNDPGNGPHDPPPGGGDQPPGGGHGTGDRP